MYFFVQLSGLLDAVDGHAARMLNQSSKFGAMLDMLTDRCATMYVVNTKSRILQRKIESMIFQVFVGCLVLILPFGNDILSNIYGY